MRHDIIEYFSFNFNEKLETSVLAARKIVPAIVVIVEVTIIAVSQMKLKLHYWHIGSCFPPFPADLVI